MHRFACGLILPILALLAGCMTSSSTGEMPARISMADNTRVEGRATGLKPPAPPEMRRRIMSQNVKAARIARIASSAESPSTRPARPEMVAAAALPDRFDWTTQLVSMEPARNQQDCGSCWDFATVAALEASAVIKGYARDKVDASEQAVLDCVPNYDCDGGWWDEPFTLMLQRGLPHETDYPYEMIARKNRCRLNEPNPPTIRYRALNWDYVDRDNQTFIPTNEALKRALVRYGPIVVAFNATPKFLRWGPADKGVFKIHDTNEVNHGILLVGWDDTLEGGAWKIRNSWGPRWGQNGYAWIGYGVNKIGFNAAWIEAADPKDPLLKDPSYVQAVGGQP